MPLGSKGEFVGGVNVRANNGSNGGYEMWNAALTGRGYVGDNEVKAFGELEILVERGVNFRFASPEEEQK